MNRVNSTNQTRHSIGNVLYWAVGTLLVLTMLSIWMTGGLFAKYIVADDVYDSARVAKTGIGKFELLEHEASETYEDSGVYKLESTEKKENKYDKVIPGVDIPKDPFIRLELNNLEVSYELYLRVTESDPFPENVIYNLTGNWKQVDVDKNGAKIYQYVDDTGKPIVFEAGKSYSFTNTGENDNNKVIKILKDDKLYVSEHYIGIIEEFSLKFSAYLKQVNTN